MTDAITRARQDGILLYGERGFPVLHDLVGSGTLIDYRDLELTSGTERVLERWIRLLEEDERDGHEEALLTGVRAACGIARDSDFSVAVQLAMRDPREGGVDPNRGSVAEEEVGRCGAG